MDVEKYLRDKWDLYLSHLKKENSKKGLTTYGNYMYLNDVSLNAIGEATKLLAYNVYITEEAAEKCFEGVLPYMITKGNKAIYGWTAYVDDTKINNGIIEALKLWDDTYNAFVEEHLNDIDEDEEIVYLKHLYNMDNPVYKLINPSKMQNTEIQKTGYSVIIDALRGSHRIEGLISILPKED